MGKFFRLNGVVRVLGLHMAGALLVATVLAAAVDADDGLYPSPYLAGTREPVLLTDSSFGPKPHPAVPLANGPSETTLLSEEPSVDQSAALGATGAPGSAWPEGDPEVWTWQVLPDGLIYHSYLAGAKEPRIGSHVGLRARLGLDVGHARWADGSAWSATAPTIPAAGEGFRSTWKGPAQPRLDMEHMEDVIGRRLPLRRAAYLWHRRFQTKLAFYHSARTWATST